MNTVRKGIIVNEYCVNTVLINRFLVLTLPLLPRTMINIHLIHATYTESHDTVCCVGKEKLTLTLIKVTDC